LTQDRAVVALESTVIAHGLPRPQNLETAAAVEGLCAQRVRRRQRSPCSDGELCVGLSDGQRRLIADDADVKKLSTRDIAVAVARRLEWRDDCGRDDVDCASSGIKVFATGGIGGVHRGSLPDVSADLPELARTPMIVVCSGAKIVLDLPATREWLETHSVTVVGYGCDETAGVLFA
jgi:pseudouridine-5'-phosphate glycosidase